MRSQASVSIFALAPTNHPYLIAISSSLLGVFLCITSYIHLFDTMCIREKNRPHRTTLASEDQAPVFRLLCWSCSVIATHTHICYKPLVSFGFGSLMLETEHDQNQESRIWHGSRLWLDEMSSHYSCSLSLCRLGFSLFCCRSFRYCYFLPLCQKSSYMTVRLQFIFRIYPDRIVIIWQNSASRK